MKERLTTVLAALCLLMPFFSSCETKDKPKDPIGTSIAGTYSGDLTYSVMGYPAGNIEGVYDLAVAEDDDKGGMAVTLPECSFTYPGSTAGAYTIPALTVSGVDVVENGGVYTLNEDDFSVVIGGATYTGRLYGTIAGKDTRFEYTVRPGRMPMDINFTFTGTRK